MTEILVLAFAIFCAGYLMGYSSKIDEPIQKIVHSEYYVKSKLDLSDLQFNLRCNNGTFQVVILDGKRYVTDESYRAYKNENCI